MTIKLEVFFDKNCQNKIKKYTRSILHSVFRNITYRFHETELLSDSSYNYVRSQFDASVILEILNNASPNDYFLGIVDQDLFINELNFVFGVAQIGRGAVISTFRLSFSADESLFKLRLEKTIKHELGHVFGLRHCINNCVMRFANSLYELDLKPNNYCDNCYRYLKSINVFSK